MSSLPMSKSLRTGTGGGGGSSGDARALESAVGDGAMSSKVATKPAEAAVAVVLEQLEVGEPVEKESKPVGTMRIRADTRRAPTRTGRRAQGAPLGVLGISRYIPSTSLRGHGSRGMLAGGNTGSHHVDLLVQRPKRYWSDTSLCMHAISQGTGTIPKDLLALGPLPYYLGPLPCTVLTIA